MSDRERVALLEECRTGIDRHEARALAVRPLLPVLGWSTLLLAVRTAGATGPDDLGGDIGWLLLLVLLLAAFARLVRGRRWVGHAAGAMAFLVVGPLTLPPVEGAPAPTRGALLATMWTAMLVVRLRAASSLDLALALALLVAVVAVLVVAGRALRRRRRVRVFPPRRGRPRPAAGPEPRGHGHRHRRRGRDLPRAAGSRARRPRPRGRPGVVETPAVRAFAGECVALLTTGAPVVLVGRGVADLPALRQRREPTRTSG